MKEATQTPNNPNAQASATGNEGEAQTQKPLEELSAEELVQKVTELTQANETLTAEKDGKEIEIVRLQNLTRSLQRKDVSGLIEALNKRFDGLEDNYDELYDMYTAQYGEGAGQAAPKTRRQVRAENRAAATKVKETPSEEKLDPDIQEFVNYVHTQNMTIEHPLVKEAITKNPNDAIAALTYLQSRVSEQTQADKSARQAEIDNAVQKAMKDAGLSGGGAKSPLGPAFDREHATADEKIVEGLKLAREKQGK